MKKTGILLLGLVWAASSVGLTKAMFWPDAALTVQASSVQPSPGSADETKPKFGADAVPIQQARDYLRSHEAPDFWALMPYYTPQATGSSCSAASIAMLVNALRGIPALAKDTLITEASLLETVGNREWVRNTALGGDGVSWAELEAYLRQSLGNKSISIAPPAKRGAPVEVKLGDEFIGVLHRDEEEGEVSYAFHMTILEEDLPAPAARK